MNLGKTKFNFSKEDASAKILQNFDRCAKSCNKSVAFFGVFSQAKYCCRFLLAAVVVVGKGGCQG